MALPTDDKALRRQRLDLLGRRAELAASMRSGQRQLADLLGLPAEDDCPLSPAADLSITAAPLDVEAAVAQGLAARPDLAGLRLLRDCLTPDTLPAARSGMQRINGLLGADLKRCAMLACLRHAAEAEESTRRSQLDSLLSDRTRAADEEIRRAAAEVRTRLRLAALAKEKWDLWQAEAADLREKRRVEKATPFDVSAARLNALGAESDAIRAAAAWKIALVKLRQAQGLLASECGFPLPSACCR
jgi:hypothetical protein